MEGFIFGLLYCLGIEYACHEAETSLAHESLIEHHNAQESHPSQPQEVLELLQRLKVGEHYEK